MQKGDRLAALSFSSHSCSTDPESVSRLGDCQGWVRALELKPAKNRIDHAHLYSHFFEHDKRHIEDGRFPEDGDSYYRVALSTLAKRVNRDLVTDEWSARDLDFVTPFDRIGSAIVIILTLRSQLLEVVYRFRIDLNRNLTRHDDVLDVIKGKNTPKRMSICNAENEHDPIENRRRL